MIKTFPCCAELSTSKVTAMMTQLIKANLVVRTSDKRKSYFHKVIAE
jgi:DNA-binding transcriptional regulator GbsR (MarR family)